MIFNIMVDAAVWALLAEVCRPQEVQHGLGWVTGERNLVFYVDDGRMAGQDQIWVQETLMVTVKMFRSVELKTNQKNTKSMV